MEQAIAVRTSRAGTFRDYVSLAKPRTVILHLITAAAAMFLAAGGVPSLPLLSFTLAGGGLLAGASNTLNCYFDRDLDSKMERTRNRPLPSGRLSPAVALAFGISAATAGAALLYRFVGVPEALLAIGALVYYVGVYTLWLKRRTRWSAVIGSAAGAVPPLVGWVAVTGKIAVAPFLLFAIIGLWTPPHFWSLAIYRHRDYELAGLDPAPVRTAPSWILVCSLLLVVATLSAGLVAGLGIIYLSTASVLGFVLVLLALRLRVAEDSATARWLYVYSIFYLVAVFAVMIIDRSGILPS